MFSGLIAGLAFVLRGGGAAACGLCLGLLEGTAALQATSVIARPRASWRFGLGFGLVQGLYKLPKVGMGR